jgi:3D (Asp-Asp-Asp) domain-containing protein
MFLVTLSACSHKIQPAQPAPTPPPQQPPARVAAAPVRFLATAYCTGRITASGAPVARGIVAADPDILPLGTVIRISGAASYNGTYRVLDTGGLIRKHRVDLYIPDCAAARRFGRRPVQVTVIRFAS